MSEDVEVLAAKRIDDDRRDAHVRIGDITIRSLWIVGLASSKPRTSWPQTSKGYPIVEAMPELKARVDRLVLDDIAATTRSRPRRAARRPAAKAGPAALPDFDASVVRSGSKPL